MGKSIRSKIKRKNRTEFRRTIGTEAYDANMAKTQAKLKEYTEKQQLNSFDRLSKTLDTDNDNNSTTAMDTEQKETDVKTTTDTTTDVPGVVDYRGENRAIPNRKMSRKKKHMLMGQLNKKSDAAIKARKERPKPRFYCEF